MRISCSVNPCSRARVSSRRPASRPSLTFPSSHTICALNTEVVRVASSIEQHAEKNGGSTFRISLYRRLSNARRNASSTSFAKYPPGVDTWFASYLNVIVTVVLVCSLSTTHVMRGSSCGAMSGRCTSGFFSGWPTAGAHDPNAFSIIAATSSRSAKSPAATIAMRSGRYHFL